MALNVRIHTGMSEDEHRKQLLLAVNTIASLMSANHDTDVVLTKITELTRDLTGADMAYISINDVKETFIQYSTGVETQEYRNIRMPLGTGVLGKAAVGHGSVQTYDYLVDPDIIHLEEIDETVRGERVRSILGVPIKVHGVLHGALLVANRTPGGFTSTIHDTVTTLALHTAVALDQARRFKEVSLALAGMRESYIHSEEQLLSLEQVVNLDALLSDSLTQYQTLEHFAATATKGLGTSIAILNSHGEVLISADQVLDETQLHLAAELGRRAYAAGRPIILNEITTLAATAGSEHLGTLLLFEAVPTPLLPRVSRVNVYLSILLLFIKTQRGERRQQDQALVDDLLHNRTPTPEGVQRLDDLLHAQPATLLLLRDTEDRAGTSMKLLGPLSKCVRELGIHDSHTLAVRHHRHVCLMIPARKTTEFVDLAMQRAKEAGMHLQCAIGPDISEPQEFAQAHTQTENALGALSVLGPEHRVLHAERLGVIGTVLRAHETDPHGYSPLDEIQPLVAYDIAHDTELTRTAWIYVESQGNVKGTARSLIVHENTVRQRLARVEDIIGKDWQDPLRFLNIHVALRIWAMQNKET